MILGVLGWSTPAAATTPTLVLDNDATGALLGGTNLAPGTFGASCVAISYDGAVAGDRLGLFAAVSGTGLANDLQVSIDEGTGGHYGDCSGFSGSSIFNGTLAAFGSAHGNANDVLLGSSLTAGNGVVSYRFVVTMGDDNAAQGTTADASFTWVGATSTAPTTPTPSPPASSIPSSPAASIPPSIAPPAESPRSPTASAVAPLPPAATPSDPGSGVAGPVHGPNGTTPSAGSSPPAPPSSLAPPDPQKSGSTTVPLLPGGPGNGGPKSNTVLDRLLAALGRVGHTIARNAAPVARGTAFGLAFVPILLLFVVVHSRIDGRDPKLANAPILATYVNFQDPAGRSSP